MINVGSYGLVLQVSANEVAPWLRPVIEAGRDAAFVDTSYIHALLDERDDRHAEVRRFHDGLSASLYTSALVVAESARQFAKGKSVEQSWRWQRVEELSALLSADQRMTICAPPEPVVRDALATLQEMQRIVGRLDLCDSLSMVVLNSLRHRRVLSFDDHFRSIGASLEP